MAYFTNSQPKVRQEGFDLPPQHRPPSPSQFDPNNAMFFGHHLYNNVKPQPPTDFADDLAAFMGSTNQDITPRPHNPFDTSTTTNSYRPHNIFDVSSPAAFPPHFSVPANAAHGTTFDHSYSNFRPNSRSRSRSKVDNSNNGGRVQRHKRGSISSSSPRPISPPPSHHHHHSRPQAILIPPSNGSSHHHHPVSPLSLHMHPHTAPSAWFIDPPFRGGSGTNGTTGDSFRATDSPFSLPTPDSIPIHHSSFPGPGSLPAASPKSVSAKESPPPAHAPDVVTKQAQIASEKRRRRRESHNAVERRRRDNINEKITELATLIPECILDPNTNNSSLADTPEVFSPDGDDKKDSTAPNGASGAGGPVKANKGMILKKSVEYIRYLQQLVNAQANRNRELEAQLASKTGVNGNGSAITNNGSPSPSLASDHKSENNKDSASSSKQVTGVNSDNNENNKARSSNNNATSHPNGHPQFDVNVAEFNLADINMNMGMNMGIIPNMAIGVNGMNLNVLMGMDIFGQQHHSNGIGLLDDPMEGDEEEIEEQEGDDNSPDLDNENDVEESSHGHSSESPNNLDGTNKARHHARRRSDAIPNGSGILLGDEEERGRRRVRPGTKEVRVKTEECHEEGMDV